LLDEPTHHLDMQSCEAMMDAIDNFDGAVLMVTHNEHILHRVANKLIVFHHDRVFPYYGTYSQFLDQIGWDDQEGITIKKPSSRQQEKPKKSLSMKDKRKVRAEFIARRSKTLTPYQQKIKEIEKTIEKHEQQLQDDTQALINASHEQDGVAITKLSKSLKQTRTQTDTLYKDLEDTSEKYEQSKLAFEEEELTYK
jgi:ATP-binding cassette subfamily F protein 3